MARIRTVKPSFWSDDSVVQLSRDARLLALGLISLADDDGRFVATHHSIAGYVYPQDRITSTQVARWLDEIEQAGLIRRYQVGDRPYGYFPNWMKHQRINRPQSSPLPDPSSVNGSRTHSGSGSVNESVSDSVSHSLGEGKG